MNPTKARETVTLFKGMQTNYTSMCKTALELFTHPQASDAQIIETARALAKVKANIASTRRTLKEKLPGAYHWELK